MFYRVFGGSGHGKTNYIFERLSQCVKDGRKAFLVVPEQSAVSTEKLVIKKLGACSNLYVEVINFKRLCNRVFRQLGGLTGTHLDDGAKKMLMLMTLDRISPYLREYKNCGDNAEFAEKALSLVNELHSGKISAKMLDEASQKFAEDEENKSISQKLSDIALILEGYTASLSSVPDAVGDIYEKLCEKLKKENFFEGADVFFDSFYSFTAIEYEIISLIAEQADNTYVTFVCDKDEKDAVFERSTSSAKKCLKIAEKSGCEIVDIELSDNRRHKNPSALYEFEKGFSSDVLSQKKTSDAIDGSINTVICRNIYDEVKWAAGLVLRLVRSGADFSDIVICAKNTSDYEGVIDITFEKAGIPIGMDLPETLAESALFELVLAALEASGTFSTQSVLRYIKTGLTGLDEEEADVLEMYMRTWNISPKLMKSDEDWTMNPDGYVESEPDEYILFVVNRARKKVVMCLESLHDNLKESRTVKDYCLAIFNLLKDITRASGKEQFDDANGSVSTKLLYECLDSFCACAGTEKLDLSRFIKLFRNCGKDYDTGRIPALANQVRFAGVDLVRCEGAKHVLLLGVNSGVFPSSCHGASLITDNEKQKLKDVGINISEGTREMAFDELFLAYCAISGASESCYVSYLAEDLSSSQMFPSVIITALRNLCGCKTQHFDASDTVESFAGNEMLFEEMSLISNPQKKLTLNKYFSNIPKYKDRLENLANANNQSDSLLRSTTDMLYGDKIVTSYSRLEKMAGCPFSHFCTYTLGLKPEPVAQLGSAETGSVMHKILEELVPLLCSKNESGEYPGEDEAKALVTKLLCEHLSRIAHTDVTRVPKRFVYLYNRLSRLLFEMAVNIVRELKVTKFVPCDFELNISQKGEIKPHPIDIGDGCTLYIVGQIDRVDVYEKDGTSYVRIVDYKTGKKTFRMKDIKNGFNLQMLLYLASVSKDASNRYGEKVVPAGVLYSNVVSYFPPMSLGADDIEARAENVSKPVSSGILLDDNEILMAMDPTENSLYLPIGRKGGEVTKKDAVASLEELGELLSFAEAASGQLAKQIRSGVKSVTPFDGKKAQIDIDPCKYCDMKPVCMGAKPAQTEKNGD